MQEREFYNILVRRYLNKQLNDTELEVFIQLGKEGKLDEQLTIAMDAEIELIKNVPAASSSKKLWYRMVAAASVLLIVLAGLFFFMTPHKDPYLSKNDIYPGGSKAILTLAGGQKIALNDAVDGKLAEQAGIEITKTQDGQLVYHLKDAKADTALLFNTVTTPRGGKYQVYLPDGTKVWLNAASTLTFPASFANQRSRRVELSGEAYFEVAKNNAIAFYVNTGKQEVKVLGTHFNINSYQNEPEIKTTLLEGSVQVTSMEIPALKQILKPGEQAVYNSGRLTVKLTDTDAEVAWKDGQFNFEDEDIYGIMRKIERWYDIEVIYKDKVNKETFGGKISINRPLRKTLQMLESTGKVHFKIEGRRITVMP